MHRLSRSVILPIVLVPVTLLLAGCPAADNPPPQPQPANRQVDLRLVVVDDPALAEAIGRLKGEWVARAGGTLEIRQMKESELRSAKVLDADAVIYPASCLGVLAERDWLVPVPDEVLESPELAWSEIFELLRVGEVTWAQKVYGIPFGSPVLTFYYRRDLFEKFNRTPPRTWEEYQQLVDFFSQRENLGELAPPPDAPWSATLEPLGPGWAGRVLLARAASYARHPDNYSTVFNFESMEPLIAGPPFVRALEELVAAAKTSSADPLQLDPAVVQREFFQGHSAMAFSWPGSSESEPAESTPSRAAPAGFAELPGSEEVFNLTTQAWDSRNAPEISRVPLLAIAARQGAVLQQSPSINEAFQLLIWLSGPEWSARVSPASPATTLFRRSQLGRPQPWLGSQIDPEGAKQYTRSLQQAWNRPTWMFALRIPGEEEYLAALDQAVEQSVRQMRPPQEALEEAADAWRKITERLGLESQRRAYRNSLNLAL